MASATVCVRLRVPSSVWMRFLTPNGDAHSPENLALYCRRDATSPNSDTSWLPGHEGWSGLNQCGVASA
jgi:hypothetical protein